MTRNTNVLLGFTPTCRQWENEDLVHLAVRSSVLSPLVSIIMKLTAIGWGKLPYHVPEKDAAYSYSPDSLLARGPFGPFSSLSRSSELSRHGSLNIEAGRRSRTRSEKSHKRQDGGL